MSAIVIGIILGGMAEQNFVGSLIMSDGSFSVFWTRPICLLFLTAAFISLLSPFLGKLLRLKNKAFKSTGIKPVLLEFLQACRTGKIYSKDFLRKF